MPQTFQTIWQTFDNYIIYKLWRADLTKARNRQGINALLSGTHIVRGVMHLRSKFLINDVDF